MEPLLTSRRAAELLGVARSTMDRLRQRDETFPKPLRFGRRCYRYSPLELRSWAESRRETVTEAETPQGGAVRGA